MKLNIGIFVRERIKMLIVLRKFSIFAKQHFNSHQSVYRWPSGAGIVALQVRHFKYQGT